MRLGLERVRNNENHLIRDLDKAGGNLQKRMEGVLPSVERQVNDYHENVGNKLWEMKNQGIIDYMVEARKLLQEFGSSQIIQEKLGDDENPLEIENPDDGRLLAYCRVLEINKQFEN